MNKQTFNINLRNFIPYQKGRSSGDFDSFSVGDVLFANIEQMASPVAYICTLRDSKGNKWARIDWEDFLKLNYGTDLYNILNNKSLDPSSHNKRVVNDTNIHKITLEIDADFDDEINILNLTVKDIVVSFVKPIVSKANRAIYKGMKEFGVF